jgi:Ser/Thr protein kinase RdoA (MazF antagonist)
VDSRITASDVDPRRALAQLGYDDVSDPRPVSGGWETLLWHFSTRDGAEHALRIYRLDNAEQTAWRERIATETCAAAGVSTPRIETSGTYEGLPTIVQTWCPGTPLMTLLERRPWQIHRLGRTFGAMHARLHTLPAPPEFAATAPDDWLFLVLPEHQRVVEHLRGHAAIDTLVHFDYHPLNVIVDGPRVSVIDWAYSAAGDVRADLALTAETLEAGPVPPGPMRPLLNVARRVALRGWRAGYEETAGAMPDFRPFRAWACAMLLRGTVESIGRPGVWATEKDLDLLRARVDRLSREA